MKFRASSQPAVGPLGEAIDRIAQTKGWNYNHFSRLLNHGDMSHLMKWRRGSAPEAPIDPATVEPELRPFVPELNEARAARRVQQANAPPPRERRRATASATAGLTADEVASLAPVVARMRKLGWGQALGAIKDALGRLAAFDEEADSGPARRDLMRIERNPPAPADGGPDRGRPAPPRTGTGP